MIRQLWSDDGGVVALEYLLVATVIGLALVVGLSAVVFGLNAELTELAQALSAINQSYGTSGMSVTSYGSSQPGAESARPLGAFWHGWSTSDIQRAGVVFEATPPPYTLTVDQVP